MAAFFPISELSAYQNKWTIKAKVTNKTPVRIFGQGKKVFSVELLDGAGGEIRASFFADAANKYLDVLQIGKVFTFSRGTVKVANKQYSTSNHRYELTFDRDAQVAEVAIKDGEATEEYKVIFNFVDFKTAHSKQVPCRADLCGVVVNFRPVATINAKDGRELVKRDITVVDDTAKSIDLTLWGENAKLPDSNFEGKPVVGFKNILLKDFNGSRVGGTVDTSVVMFKPEVPEAKRIQDWWSNGGSGQSFASVTTLVALAVKPLPCRVDLCGVVVGFKPVATVNTKEGKELVKRDITIADETGRSMDVTLWNAHGQRPEEDFEGNPTILVTSVLVKEWNGGRAGSTLEASMVVLKPDVPEGKKLEQWWSQGGSSQSIVSMGGSGGGGGAAAKAEHCTIADMRMKSEAVGEQAQLYKINARLSVVQTRKQGEQMPLHYKSCCEMKEGQYGKLPCNRRVDEAGFCAACGVAGKTATRMNLRCQFSDFSNSVWLTTFHEAAEKVVGMTADKVAEVEGANGRDMLDSVIMKGYFGQPMELTVRAKLDSYNGEPRANVTCIGAAPVDRPTRGRKMLADIQDMLAATA